MRNTYYLVLKSQENVKYTHAYKEIKSTALCVIFTILVSFSQDNALFASKAKLNVFWKFFEQSGPKVASGVKKSSF